jgi:hypothetical protein
MDTIDAELRKDEGQSQALENEKDEWKQAALNVIRDVARRERFFIVDSVRQLAKEKNIGEPRNHAVWGAVFRQAAREKIIKKTHRYRASSLKANNMGLRNVWRSLL